MTNNETYKPWTHCPQLIITVRQMKKNTKLVAVGERIRSLRLEKGLTQEEFALLVGLDRSYFGGVERGERNISVLNLIKIAQALDKEIGDLFPPMSQLTKTR